MRCAQTDTETIPQAQSPSSNRPRNTPVHHMPHDMAPGIGRVQHKTLVLSGKGGVGKSTLAVNIASLLARAGRRVGLLDADIHGPSIPWLLGLEEATNKARDNIILPVDYGDHLKVMSSRFMLARSGEAAIWRGPFKAAMVKDLLEDVLWGELHHLIIDSPPGTGDEPLTVCECIPDLEAVIVTTPQQAVLLTVRKAIDFCRRLDVPVLGVVENMSGFYCPERERAAEGLEVLGGEALCRETGLPFLGRIPFDSHIVDAGDTGQPFAPHYPDREATHALKRVTKTILKLEHVGTTHRTAMTATGAA